MSTPTPPVDFVARAPLFVVTYGPSGLGKTTDFLYSFPGAYYIATPAALKPSEGVVGFRLHPSQVFEAKRIADATALLPKLPKQMEVCVIDDLSLLAERTIAALEGKYSGFKLWGALRDEVLDLRDAARSCGKHVVMNAHEQPATVKNGFHVRGGPRLPGKLPEDLPTHADLVLRTFHEPSRLGPWKVVYRCGPNDPSYVSKDRTGRCFDMMPMNTGEVFRACGFAISRAPGLEWMEPLVEKAAGMILQMGFAAYPQVLQAMGQRIMTDYTQNPLHVRWAWRDALDRALIRRNQQNVLGAFFGQ